MLLRESRNPRQPLAGHRHGFNLGTAVQAPSRLVITERDPLWIRAALSEFPFHEGDWLIRGQVQIVALGFGAIQFDLKAEVQPLLASCIAFEQDRQLIARRRRAR